MILLAALVFFLTLYIMFWAAMGWGIVVVAKKIIREIKR